MRKRWIHLMLVFFLPACRSNQSIIDEAMRNVGDQSGYISAGSDPRPLWAWLIALGFLFFLFILGVMGFTLVQKHSQKKKTPSRPHRTTKIYLPHQSGNQYGQIPSQRHSYQRPLPPNDPPDLPY
jgi:hypothetical protein